MLMENDKRSDALAEVFEAFKVINSSLRCYYAGEEHMYRAMAVQLRILFCDTQHGKDNSLLGRTFKLLELPRLQPIAWLDPGSPEQSNPHLRRLGARVPPGHKARFAKMPFVIIEFEAGLAVADIEVEDKGPLLTVDQWSDQAITTHPTRVTIRELIRLVADKGGGAHVDLEGCQELTSLGHALTAGVGQHVLFTVALARFAVNIWVHLLQLNKHGALGSPIPDFEVDPTSETVDILARVPDEIKARGAHENHLCSVRVEKL